MTAKEKAAELVEKYKEYTEDTHAERYSDAKSCALIAVDAIIESHLDNKWSVAINTTNKEYWQSVKQEIQKL